MAMQQLLLTRQRRQPIGYNELLEEMSRVDYLAEYVNKIATEVGIPDYYTKSLPSSLKKASNVNVLYPVGGGIYIHVYMPPGGTESGYRKYVVIEPPRPPMILFDLVEEKMAELVTEETIVRSQDEKRELLLKFLQQITRVVDTPVDYNSIMQRLRKGKNNLKTIPVYRRDYERLRYYLIRDKVGLGVLEPFIRDVYIEDISCDGVGYIYIVHKIFGPLETSVGFKTEEELDRFVIELSERIGKPVSHARPIVDATLPDGSRINIVFGKDVSLHGSNFTIRKFSKKPISVIQLIKWGTLDERVAAYLWMLLLEGMSGWISGETASGKTTSLNAIIAFIKPVAKIITIEDTAEVQVPHKNWVRELTRDTGSVESSVTMFDLLKAALRQRPNYIIVGEIRGAEGNVAFQAMQSVSWDTPVLIRNTETGEIKLVSIGEFIDKFYKPGEEGVPKYIDKYQVLSFDKLGNVRWSKINYVLRHRANEIYKIEYEGGGIIKATGSHSVFVLDEETLEIKPKYVSELREGDLLVTFVRISRVELEDYMPRNTYRIYLTDGGIATRIYSTKTMLLPKLDSILWNQIVKQDTVEYVVEDIDSIKNVTWTLRLLGYYTIIKERKFNNKVYYVVYGRKYYGENKKLPLKPIIELITRNELDKKLPKELKYLVYRYRKGIQRFVTGRTLVKILDFLERSISVLDEYSRDILDKLKIYLENDVVFLRVTRVEKIRYNGYVYDISVPETELFLGGTVPVALHNTGHPVLATFHAGSVERLIQRVTSPPINVPKTQLDNLNFVIIQSAVYREGVMLRRMLSVNEILGYDAAADSIIFIPVFTWDPATDRFLFRGKGASYLLEEKIATMRGISRKNLRLIYEELDLRAQILREMVRQNITDYFEVFRIIAKIYNIVEETARGKGKGETQLAVLEGLEKALKMLKRKELR